MFENILETKNLTKRFGGLTAVNDVSLTVRAGEIVGLIGPNGAGKTTLINAMSGLNPPTSGTVIFQSEDVTGFSPEKMCHLGLSRTFQIPRPFPNLTVLETVKVAAIFGGHHRGKDVVDYCAHLLEIVEFPLPINTVCNKLNTVQLKRLDLARALASNPKLLFLDEMASGLTEGELHDIIELIVKIKNMGISILIIEHIMKLIMNVCERLIVICFGEKIAEGPVREVVSDPQVIKVYLGAAPE